MTLDRYQGDRLTQAQTWGSLPEDELRRRAVKAAAEKDVDALIGLMRAYLVHEGGSGLLTSARTFEAYTLGVRQFLAYATDNAVNLLRPVRRDATGYVAHMFASGRTPAGAQLKVAAVNCLYRALNWAGATDADPFKGVKIPKDRTPGLVKRPPYTEDELADVLEHADVHGKFLLFVTAHAGLRISEALALRWDDLDEAGRRIHVRSGKGRKARVVAMSTSLARATRHYRGLYAPGGPDHADGKRTTPRDHVFRYASPMTARYHLEKAFQAAGVFFRGFHPGRKYAGTRLLQQVKDFGRVAAHLGHESIDTTRKGYAQLATDDLKDDLVGW